MSPTLAFPIPGLTAGRDGVYLVARGDEGYSLGALAAREARRRDAERVGAWVARMVDGDAKALEALMDAYVVSLTRFAATIVPSSALAEEVVQDVFVRVWEHRATLDPAGNTVGYLYRAVRNRALNIAQRERTRLSAEAHVSAAYPVGTENRALEALDAEALRTEITTALRTVAPRCREIFLMILEGQMSYDETASAIGISTRSVQNQYYKAVAALVLHFNRRPSR